MAAIHIDLVFGENNRREDDKPIEDLQEEKALLVDMEIPADEPLPDDEPQKILCSSGCLVEEK